MRLTVELASTQAQARVASLLIGQVWPGGPPPVDPELALVLATWGNYVSLACLDGEPVGACIGLRAVDEDGPHLHSHVAGVLPGHRGTGVGRALKHHQRDWTFGAGMDRITWTFDPLAARNAYFNVATLGARVTAYLVDFYGPMRDGVNDGDETDRCVATWNLASPSPSPQQPAEGTGARPVLVVGSDGWPAVTGATGDGAVRIQLPSDVVAIRRDDPDRAVAWRRAVRAVLSPAYQEGRRITQVTRDGWYVVSRAEGPATPSRVPHRR